MMTDEPTVASSAVLDSDKNTALPPAGTDQKFTG